MKRLILLLLIYISSLSCSSAIEHKHTFSKKDSTVLEKIYKDLKNKTDLKKTDVFLAFLNTPYVGKTLEINNTEKLVINLTQLDCSTFIENGISLYQCIINNDSTTKGYAKKLQTIRYRNGKIKNYTSRLHYSSDWICDNIKKGIIENITKKLNGEIFKTNVSFMSTHPSKYKALKNGLYIDKIKEIEDSINSREYYYIPKNKVASIENKLIDGDIIFITTDYKGLDISHVGFAIKQGIETHLLHASSTGRKVMISKKTLHNYLKGIKHDTGIIVCRLK